MRMLQSVYHLMVVCGGETPSVNVQDEPFVYRCETEINTSMYLASSSLCGAELQSNNTFFGGDFGINHFSSLKDKELQYEFIYYFIGCVQCHGCCQCQIFWLQQRLTSVSLHSNFQSCHLFLLDFQQYRFHFSISEVFLLGHVLYLATTQWSLGSTVASQHEGPGFNSLVEKGLSV